MSYVLPGYSSTIGLSSLFGDASAYYQSAAGTFFINATTNYTYSVVLNINPTQTGNVTQVFLNYGYMRIA